MRSEDSYAPQARLAGSWRRYLRFWGQRAEADVDDELAFHMAMRVRDYMARGMSEADARAAAMQRLGDMLFVRDACVAITSRRHRSMSRARIIDSFVQDGRFTFRTLGRQKGWTTIAVLTLALGIGATTAVFSVVNSLVLNPLSYPDADRIALVYLEPTEGNQTGLVVTVTPGASDVKAWLEGSRSMETLEAYHESDVTLEQRGVETAATHAAYIRPTFPRFAGAAPMLGRMFTDAEIRAKEPVVLLDESLWRTRFGADARVVGTVVTINEKPHTIIGILPSTLRLPRFSQTSTQLWLPLDVTDQTLGMSVIGRLRHGVSHETARRELDSLSARARTGPRAEAKWRTIIREPGALVGFRQSLTLLSAAVALVLLIACTNVAHLLLARSASRQRELAIRTALGAGRGRLFRQLLTESLALSAAGCIAGVALGAAGLRLLVAVRPQSLSALSFARLDGTALFVAIGIALATGIGFGVFAAVQAARHTTHDALKAGSLTTSDVRRHRRLRSLLVVTEMALAATLLVAASLLIRSVVHLQMLDPGFESQGLYAVRPSLPEGRYPEEATKRAFFSQLLERTRVLPGVESVAMANDAPPGLGFIIGALQLEGEAEPPAGTTAFLRYNAVSPGFFKTMGIPILEGRLFTDSTAAATEVIVNQGFARKHWQSGSAVGRRLRIIGYGGKGEWRTVIGVVADASLGGLTHDRADPVIYTPGPNYHGPSVLVRMREGVDALPALRSAVSAIDPRLPPPRLTNIDMVMAESAAQPRFTMLLLVSFTVLAVVLAAVGLYGVMTYAVAQRTREIGIRIALGATRRDVSREVVSTGLMLAAMGAVIGLTGAWWATKLLERLLYGVPRTDPISFAAGGVVLIGTAVIACLVPMNRAASVDPLIAMRAE